MARKYVWWQSPERTLQDRRLLLAQMMTLGTAEDVRWLVSRVSAADLRGVLSAPPVGTLRPVCGHSTAPYFLAWTGEPRVG